MESAGIECIDENGGGSGVPLRERRRRRSRGQGITAARYALFRIMRQHASASRQRHPLVANLFVGSFDGGPRGAVRDLLLPHVAAMRGKGMIEGLAIDILRMWGQVAAN